jgi:hypothetical protein
MKGGWCRSCMCLSRLPLFLLRKITPQSLGVKHSKIYDSGKILPPSPYSAPKHYIGWTALYAITPDTELLGTIHKITLWDLKYLLILLSVKSFYLKVPDSFITLPAPKSIEVFPIVDKIGTPTDERLLMQPLKP